MSTAFTAVGDFFALRERGRWQGLMSAVFGLASVLGPTLGGYIVDNADWHWVFWVFTPVGLASLILIWILFPSVEKRQGESIDYLGSLFLALTIIPLLLAFSWADNKYHWISIEIIGLLTASAISLTLFIITELKAKSPALPLYLFKNSIFTVSNIVGFMIGVGMFGSIMYMPFFLQGVQGISATTSGFLMMPLTLSLVIASAICGQLITKTGKYKKMALVGLFTMAVGMLILSSMTANTTGMVAVIYMIIVGIGLGVSFPIFTLTVQNSVSDKLLGVSTASTQLFRQLGGTVGVAAMATVMNRRMTMKLITLSDEGGLVIDPAELAPEFNDIVEKLKNPEILMDQSELLRLGQALPTDMQGTFNQMIDMLRESLGFALSGSFLACALAILIAFILTFFLNEIPLRTSKDHSSHGPTHSKPEHPKPESLKTN